jgi:hypothetical protein
MADLQLESTNYVASFPTQIIVELPAPTMPQVLVVTVGVAVGNIDAIFAQVSGPAAGAYSIGRGVVGIYGEPDGIATLGDGTGVVGFGSIGVAGFGDVGVAATPNEGGIAFLAEGTSGFGVEVIMNGDATAVYALVEKNGTVVNAAVIGDGTTVNYAVIAYNQGAGYGLYAQANSGQAVYGWSSGGVGIVGQTYASYLAGVQGTGDYGVHGIGNLHAVFGELTGSGFIGSGVWGDSPGDQDGVWGTTQTGYALDGNAYAGGLGAMIFGDVEIHGALTVVGTPKHAAVPHPDGSHRLLYCLECPESWFEDFGEGELRGGKARIALDPDFAAVIHPSAYHVFLTPHGDSKGLYVSHRDAHGFTVHEQQGGISDITFSYRIVAKRKDIKAERLAKYEPHRPRHEVAEIRRPTAAVPVPPKAPQRQGHRKAPA